LVAISGALPRKRLASPAAGGVSGRNRAQRGS